MASDVAFDWSAWLAQVVADPDIPAGAFRAAFLLAGFAGPGDGAARVSQTELARANGCSRRGVQKHLYALEKAGHLKIESGKVDGEIGRYIPTLVRVSP